MTARASDHIILLESGWPPRRCGAQMSQLAASRIQLCASVNNCAGALISANQVEVSRRSQHSSRWLLFEAAFERVRQLRSEHSLQFGGRFELALEQDPQATAGRLKRVLTLSLSLARVAFPRLLVHLNGHIWLSIVHNCSSACQPVFRRIDTNKIQFRRQLAALNLAGGPGGGSRRPPRDKFVVCRPGAI